MILTTHFLLQLFKPVNFNLLPSKFPLINVITNLHLPDVSTSSLILKTSHIPIKFISLLLFHVLNAVY